MSARLARSASLAFALMMVAAACGGSDTADGADGLASDRESSTPATTLSSGAPVEQDSTERDTEEQGVGELGEAEAEMPTTTGESEGSQSGPGPATEGGLVTTALWSLPQVPAEGSVQITVADLVGAEELLGFVPATADDRLRWLAIPKPLSEGGLGFQLATPEFFSRLGLGPEVLEEEAGFSLLDIDVIAGVAAAPERVDVFVGPGGWAGRAEPFQGNLLTIGQGDDLEIDPASRGVLDSLGRPVRLAERDGRLAASFSTPVLEGWVDGTGATYAGDDRLSPIGVALDAQGVVSAYLFVGDFFATPDFLSDDALGEFENLPFISQPFIAAGIGNTIRDGQAIEVIAYRFLTDDSAEAAMASIETAWTTADSVVTQSPIAELAEFQSIERTGPVVTVVVGVPEGQIGRATNMLFSRDVTLAHL